MQLKMSTVFLLKLAMKGSAYSLDKRASTDEDLPIQDDKMYVLACLRVHPRIHCHGSLYS